MSDWVSIVAIKDNLTKSVKCRTFSSMVTATASGHVAQLMSWTEIDWHLLRNLIESIVTGAPTFGYYLSNCLCFTSQPIFINSKGHFIWPSVTIIQKFNDIFCVDHSRIFDLKNMFMKFRKRTKLNGILIQNSYSMLQRSCIISHVCCHMIIVDGGIDLNVLNWKTGW